MAKWPYNTQRWKRLRALKLATDPLCEVHPDGGVVAADTVDHQDDVALGGDPFPPLHKLTSMCGSCHNRKTAYTRTHGQHRVPVKGANIDGTPKDSGHWWASS